MLPLQDSLVINGTLGGRARVPTDKTLWGRVRPDKANGGNHQLVGTLVLHPTRSPRCPLILRYLS